MKRIKKSVSKNNLSVSAFSCECGKNCYCRGGSSAVYSSRDTIITASNSVKNVR